MFTAVREEHIEALCPELSQLLVAELAAGNRVSETYAGWPRSQSIFVGLAEPFKVKPTSLPEGVVHRAIDDPHWWKAEYHHVPTWHLLVCRF